MEEKDGRTKAREEFSGRVFMEGQRMMASGWSGGVSSPLGSVAWDLKTSGKSANEKAWCGVSQGSTMLLPCVGPGSPRSEEPGVSEGVVHGGSAGQHAGAALG